MEASSKPYTVLARRFRPQAFGEVVGQGHVAQALKNAIQTGRVAHAYLFTGARGVGKTSMARILAKALNCPNAVDGDPCNTCDICEGITSGHDVDVLEIDGASNRGIDDIRTLRANVNVKSMRTRHKMYIIDEVHMLTKEAFNALLKTLEEPPPNVKFVFCTTEPNKVPDTILSRCQRFDFGTIETMNIIGRLQQIAEIEGYQVEPDALELVARRAAGSMRDSQSLFDQLLAFGQEKLTADDVHRLLGTAGDDRLIEMVEALVGRRAGEAVAILDRALTDGVQLGEFVDQLIGYLRDLMILAAGADGVGLMAISEQRRATLADQGARWGLQTILAALQILSETKTKMFRSSSARALAEMAVARISMLEDLEELSRLVQELRSGGTPAAPGSPRTTSGSGQATRPSAPTAPPVRPSSPHRGAEQASSTKPIASQLNQLAEESNQGSKIIREDHPHESHLKGAAQTPTEPTNGKYNTGSSTATSTAAYLEFRAGQESAIWMEVMSQIQDMLRDHVRVVSDTAISGPNQLDLIFPRSYHFSKQYCERSDVRARLEKLVSQVVGRPVAIVCRLADSEPGEKADTEVTTTRGTAAGASTTRQSLEEINDPYVEQAKNIFGATVVKREVLKSASQEES